jgi:ABC-type transport system, involved in lipoprotein release, permease component
VLTWDELQPEIKAFVAMKVGGSRVMEGVIGLLVAAGIFNTVFMSVLERSREFGIMRAIGYTPGQLFVLVMAECGFLGLLGLLASALVTVGPYLYLSRTGIDLTEVYAQQGVQMDIGGVGMDPILRIGIFPENAAIIAGAILAATLLAGVYPAWKAGRVDPVEAINLV